MTVETPERPRNWRPNDAEVWRCGGCNRVIGFIAGRLLRVEHMGRVLEVRGDEFRQKCDKCGGINVWPAPVGSQLDS